MFKLLLTLLAFSAVAFAQVVPFKPGESLPDTAEVVYRVLDGDTVTIKYNGVERSIRLLGANTPEVRPPQPFSAEATAFTAALAGPGTPVMLIGEGPRVDRFGRALAHILLLDAGGRPSMPLALMLLSQGLAKADLRDGADRMRGLYEAAEAGAHGAGKGLWAGTKAPPRKGCKDFTRQFEAQVYFLALQTPSQRDAARLDRDNDGVVCEKLPRAVPTPGASS